MLAVSAIRRIGRILVYTWLRLRRVSLRRIPRWLIQNWFRHPRHATVIRNQIHNCRRPTASDVTPPSIDGSRRPPTSSALPSLFLRGRSPTSRASVLGRLLCSTSCLQGDQTHPAQQIEGGSPAWQRCSLDYSCSVGLRNASRVGWAQRVGRGLGR